VLTARVPDFLHHCAVGAQLVGSDLLRPTIAFHQFSEGFQSRFTIATLGDNGLKFFVLVIDRAPRVMGFPIDLHENLVEMPLPVRIGSRPLDSGFADLRSEQRAKRHPPKEYRLMADVDPALMQEVFDAA